MKDDCVLTCDEKPRHCPDWGDNCAKTCVIGACNQTGQNSASQEKLNLGSKMEFQCIWEKKIMEEIFKQELGWV